MSKRTAGIQKGRWERKQRAEKQKHMEAMERTGREMQSLTHMDANSGVGFLFSLLGHVDEYGGMDREAMVEADIDFVTGETTF